jgi:methylmalonyl-CoA mutase
VPLVVREKGRAHAGLDAETNAVRSTLAAAAGLVGGADAVASLPFAEGPLAARLAWTESEVLVREARLHLVDDAAEGAPFVEALTEQIGEAAWALCRDELRAPGALAARLAADAEARERAVRTRRRPLVGVSRFAAAGTARSDGDAAPFERLRAAVPAGRRAAVVWLGDAKLAARVEFAREALELLGVPVHVAPPASSVDEAAKVDADLALIAAADGDFAGPVVALAEALVRRGVRVAVAGTPKDAEGPLRAAGVASFLFVGGDVVSALEALIGGGS